MAPPRRMRRSRGRSRSTDYPIEVRKTLSLGPVTCRKWRAAARSRFAPDTVRKVDFNGDGRMDYVVSFENTDVRRPKTGGFCGTGGCRWIFW